MQSTSGSPITTVVTWILVKPAVLVGLYELIRWVTLVTGFQLGLIASLADSFSRTTGMPHDESIVVVIGLIACSGWQVLSAAWGLIVATTRS
jgi:hypothetical protein